MKKLLLSFLIVTTLFGCSKSGDSSVTPDKEEVINSVSKITFDRDVVGVNQTVICKVDKPTWAGNIIAYKWEFTSPDGKTGTLNTTENSAILAPIQKGKYKIKVYVSSKGIEGNNTGEITTRDCDFGVGIYGNEKKIINDAKEFDNKYAETGLSSGFYWPFTASKPEESISFKTGNSYEKYIFINDKLVAGSTQLINEPFRTVTNGVERNLSYGRFLELALKWNKVFNTNVEPKIQWRNGITEEAKKRYETSGATKNDGIGWAVMNRDISEITIEWSNNSVEYKAHFKAMGDNRNYEIKFAIRKK